MNNSKLHIATITKPHGIKGEVKLLVHMQDKDRFNQIKTVFVGAQRYTVNSLRISGSVAYVKFDTVDSRSDAQFLVKEYVYIDRVDDTPLQEYEYYVKDILGCQIYLDGVLYGQLTDIDQYGAADVHVVKTVDGLTVRHPFLKVLVRSIDIDSQRIDYYKSEFERVMLET